MNALKKILGLVWMACGPLAIIFLVYEAFKKIQEHPGDQSVYLPWIIIVTIFTPIAIGLVIFGYYSWNREYDR